MSARTVDQAVARQEKPGGVVEQYRSDFAAVLPSHIKPDQWVRLTQGVIRRNPALQSILDHNPGSVLSALLDCARLGLEIGHTYHLVPMGGEVVGITDYTGLIELIYRAGAVRSVKVEVVYDGDLMPDENGKLRFRWIPSDMDRPYHAPNWFGDRGSMIGAYAYAVMADGSVSQVVMRNRDEIEKVRAVSKTAKRADGPWVMWPDRMWCKTVLRELAKFVPTSSEFRARRDAGSVEQRDRPDAPLPPVLLDDDVLDVEIVEHEVSDGSVGTAKLPD